MIDSITITEGMKTKDLPPEYKCAFEHIEGALPAVCFKGGSFYAIEWVPEETLTWPNRVETKAHPGDQIIIADDWGVEIKFAEEKQQ